MQLPAHGSNPSYLYKALGIKEPKQIIDFSVNTNPLGAPAEVHQHWQKWLEAIYDYPDPYCNSLKEAIASKEAVDTSHLLIGNGAAEIITLIARYLHRKNILIMQPAFSEYETACLHEKCSIEYCKQSKVLLIVDEAFYDFATHPRSAVSKIHQSPYLLILRSLTKMYNIAGLRLGFLIGQPEILEHIVSFQPHWSVNAIALKAGELFSVMKSM